MTPQPPLSLALIQTCLKASPVPALDAYAQGVMRNFAFLIPFGVPTSAKALAATISESYDLDHPRTFFDYSVLMHVELVVVKGIKGVRSGKRPLNAITVSFQAAVQQTDPKEQ